MAQTAIEFPTMTSREPSPLDEVVHKAGAALLALRMARIGQWHPDEQDAKALLEDIDAICHIIDPVVLAIGDYANQHFGRVDLSLFTNQLRDTLDGNATYAITSAAEALAQERLDTAGDER